MKIVVVSDSHGFDEGMKKVFAREQPMDAVFHLGDSQEDQRILEQLAGCPVYGVSGNCDYFTDYPGTRIDEICGHRIFMTHGHRYFIRQMGTKLLVSDAQNEHCDLALFGHTHCPLIQERGGVTVLNPGSISRPRQADGRCSYMVLKLEKGKRAEAELKYL